MQLSPASCYSFHLRTRYSPQHLFLKILSLYPFRRIVSYQTPWRRVLLENPPVAQLLYPPFEVSFPWFESKLNVTHLEQTPYTSFQQNLRASRLGSYQFCLRAINCSSLELEMFLSFWCSWVLSCCIERNRAQRRKGATPRQE
jgi:hypothetical protein